MAFHHLALVTGDSMANHLFYTRAMGFELVKTVVGETPEGGWAKHLFYDTGEGELMAFWELHDPAILVPARTGMSTGLGLPEWVNHVAFGASDLPDLERRRERLVSHGYDVLEIDHGWCTSIYTRDPDGNLVEFCTTTREFEAEERSRAVELLRAERPPLEAPGPAPKVHRTEVRPVHLGDAAP
jgi:catechol 2,3-dioxygenase-like lactoylglutathione lyase family enzyme